MGLARDRAVHEQHGVDVVVATDMRQRAERVLEVRAADIDGHAQIGCLRRLRGQGFAAFAGQPCRLDGVPEHGIGPQRAGTGTVANDHHAMAAHRGQEFHCCEPVEQPAQVLAFDQAGAGERG